jgi:hypothetical protein
MEDYLKYADSDGSIILINIYKNVSGYKLFITPVHFQDIMPDDLFSFTNIQKEFKNLVLSPNKKPLSVKNPPKKNMPNIPVYMEAKTWIYKYLKGSFFLYDIRMTAIML